MWWNQMSIRSRQQLRRWEEGGYSSSQKRMIAGTRRALKRVKEIEHQQDESMPRTVQWVCVSEILPGKWLPPGCLHADNYEGDSWRTPRRPPVARHAGNVTDLCESLYAVERFAFRRVTFSIVPARPWHIATIECVFNYRIPERKVGCNYATLR